MAISQIKDKNLDTIKEATRGVLILTKSDCGHCATYAREIEAAQAEGGFEDVAIGKLVLDAPGAARFKLKNPWIGKLPTLPYTLLFADGKAVDHFAASKASYLAERLERFATAAV